MIMNTQYYATNNEARMALTSPESCGTRLVEICYIDNYPVGTSVDNVQCPSRQGVMLIIGRGKRRETEVSRRIDPVGSGILMGGVIDGQSACD